MRVEAKVYKDENGCCVWVDIDLDVTIRLNNRKDLKIVKGKWSDDEDKLAGIDEFSRLVAITKHIKDMKTAESAIQEIKSLLFDLEQRESTRLKDIEAVEAYLNEQLKQIINENC